MAAEAVYIFHWESPTATKKIVDEESKNEFCRLKIRPTDTRAVPRTRNPQLCPNLVVVCVNVNHRPWNNQNTCVNSVHKKSEREHGEMLNDPTVEINHTVTLSACTKGAYENRGQSQLDPTATQST